MLASSFSYLVVLALIGVIMPILGVLTGKRTRELLIGSPELKIPVYKQAIAILWFLTAVTLMIMNFNQDPISQIGIGFINRFPLVITLIIICLVFLLLVQLFDPDTTKYPWLKTHFNRVMYLIPATSDQLKWGLALSFTAGICEEIIYRGFLFEQVSLYMHEVPALVLINIIFALCHWGTGLKNALWSFGLGVGWSVSYLLTGSLWLAMLTHIMVDILSLTVGYKIQKHQQLMESAK